MEGKSYIYDFYKSPDGEDCLVKLWFATKYGAMTGFTVSLMDIGMVTFPKTIPHGLARIANYTLPYAAMGAAFAATSCISGQLRKKDDFFNHALGGLAMGAIHGAKNGCAVKGGKVGGLFAVILGGLKFLKTNDIPFMNISPRNHNTYNRHLDFSIKFYDDPGRPLDP